ncbi:MAG TPA: hypothetical protein VHM19_04440 [Polyangiales bacterium]|jgi:predicted  nucleic acid-binding Zn-ribbon protein|nr:hypothetical protein [Polyangiales bacterium]
MNESNEQQNSLKRELDALTELRDALRVRLHLAKADVRDEWQKLEKSWSLVENEAKRVGAHSKGSASEIGRTVGDLVKELQAGYRHVRSQLEESSHHT